MGYKHNIEDIIERGGELFRKKGYHNVGINEILRECGIPKGSFYNFFESKEDFARQVLVRYGENSLKNIKSFLTNSELSPLERLKSFYAFVIDANEGDGFENGCLVNNISIEVGGISMALARTAEESFAKWLKAIADCVREGQEKGEIITDMSAEDIAEYLHAGTYGAFSRMKVNRDRVYLDKWYKMTFNFISK